MFAWLVQIVSDLGSQTKFKLCTCFPAAMLVSFGGTPTKRFYTGLCKFVQNISKNIEARENVQT